MSPRLEIAQPRIAWLLLIANTALVFGYPAIFFQIKGDDYAGELLATHDAWSWDWQVWLLPLAAMVLPRLGPFTDSQRLAVAATFCLPTWLVLLQTSFLEPHGCMSAGWVRSVPEHLAFASLLLTALLAQIPTPSLEASGPRAIRNPARGR